MPLSVYPPLEDMVFWNGDNIRWGLALNFRVGCAVTESETGGHAGPRCLHIQSNGPKWCGGWGSENPYEAHNVSEYAHLSFWVKCANAEGAQRDIKVALFDTIEGEELAGLSNEAWLLKDGYLAALSPGWQQVRIPVGKLLKIGEFHIDICGGVAFGGDTAGHDFFIDDIGFDAR